MATAKVLIDRDKAQAVLQNMAEHLMEAGNPEMAGAVGYAAEVVSKQHKVDAVEVVYGRWVNPYMNRYGHPCHCCSVCGFKASYQDKNYCPNCGAKMDGGDKDA